MRCALLWVGGLVPCVVSSFCVPPEAYKAIKFHQSMLTLVNHGVLPDSNLFNASVKASLPAFQAMTVDGLTFVNTGLL